MFNSQTIEDIKKDAIARHPEESCGFILRDEEKGFVYRPLKNLSPEPLNSFRIDERLVLRALPRLAAVVHSHPNGPDCPSETDMAQQIQYNIPFGIVSTDGSNCLEPFFWGDGVEVAPLVGRGFRHGITDCYGLIRDYYATLGVKLSPVAREWGWWSTGQRLYEDYLEKEGFFRISESEVKPNDGFLAQIRSTTPNHAGIYLGNSLILHHVTAKNAVDLTSLSRKEPVGNWSKFISGFWVRHKAFAQ